MNAFRKSLKTFTNRTMDRVADRWRKKAHKWGTMERVINPVFQMAFFWSGLYAWGQMLAVEKRLGAQLTIVSKVEQWEKFTQQCNEILPNEDRASINKLVAEFQNEKHRTHLSKNLRYPGTIVILPEIRKQDTSDREIETDG